jgi:hypothetical protein
MACGCKNNQSKEPKTNPNAAQKNSIVQNAVKSVIEKYYNKKK